MMILLLAIIPLVSGTPETELLLDPSIRDWVVLPMVLMLVLVGMGRAYVQQLIRSDPVIAEKDLSEIRYKQTAMASARLRQNGHFIGDKAFRRRRQYLVAAPKSVNAEGEATGGGLLRETVPGAGNPMSNPNMMVDMLKNNMVFMLPNFAMMAFVGHFFSGFVCLKVPFQMPSNHFKAMLQRGVDLTTLDVSYVSSLCMYFLVSFGLNGVYRLLLDEGTEVDDMKGMMAMQMGMGMAGGGGPAGFNAKEAYKGELAMMDIVQHKYGEFTDGEERRLLGDRYPMSDDLAAADFSSFK